MESGLFCLFGVVCVCVSVCVSYFIPWFRVSESRENPRTHHNEHSEDHQVLSPTHDLMPITGGAASQYYHNQDVRVNKIKRHSLMRKSQELERERLSEHDFTSEVSPEVVILTTPSSQHDLDAKQKSSSD